MRKIFKVKILSVLSLSARVVTLQEVQRLKYEKIMNKKRSSNNSSWKKNNRQQKYIAIGMTI